MFFRFIFLAASNNFLAMDRCSSSRLKVLVQLTAFLQPKRLLLQHGTSSPVFYCVTDAKACSSTASFISQPRDCSQKTSPLPWKRL